MRDARAAVVSTIAFDRAAADAANAIAGSFIALRARFDRLTLRAAEHFARRDWSAAQRDATARLLVFQREAESAIGRLREVLGDRLRAHELWPGIRAAYAAAIADRHDHEIAATFFNSVARRVLGTVGVDSATEFLYGALDGAASREPELRRCPVDRSGIAEMLAALSLGAEWEDLDRDAGAVADAVRERLDVEPSGLIGRIELLATPFYRNKGAYLVGRARTDTMYVPVIVALLHGDAGIHVDAVLTTSDEASVVFGFSWSYFQVAVECPRAVVEFLGSIMPLKRIDELYTSIGFHKHGKTELYRGLLAHLRDGHACFERASGQPGLVMAVVALPSFNLVLKIIRDSFGFPKRSTRRQVVAQYRFVFLRDRVGRLADAQEFERLELPRHAFPDDLLAELLAAAPTQVHASDESVVIAHCYTQRHLEPLDVHLLAASPEDARAAIREYGQAVEDLAHAGIFPGDMLLKNFGLSRHGRVIFYDYDEIEDLDDVCFRHLPEGDEIDELASEPWYSIGEHDAFPEQFIPFLIPAGPLRDEFLAAHAALLTPEWWLDIQQRIRAGEMFDVYPYPPQRRLRWRHAASPA